jgi:hypothetical protein
LGVGATTRFLPVHVLAERLGESLCQVLVAVHTLTGCDYTSKFGTKHAGLNCVPEEFLTNFGTLIGDQSESMANAEEFLVQVLKKGSSCKTLNELRHWLYCHGKNIQLEDLPPTSSSATYHILRAFHATYMQVSCLDDKRQLLDMTKFGYSDDDDCFVPTRLLVMYPDEDELVPSCTCGKCARRTCVCTAAGIPCCIYCKCRSVANIDCRNQH